MPVKTIPLRVPMRGGTHIENVTKLVQDALGEAELQAGIVTLFLKHTTASVLIIEDEPGLRADTKTLWDRLIPQDPAWAHNTMNPGEDNGHSHLRGQLQGQSLTVPFQHGELLLGTWQQLVVVDFDTRARARDLVLQIIGE